jgi:hypothetical protein
MDNPRTHPALGTIHITKISIAILGFVQIIMPLPVLIWYIV